MSLKETTTKKATDSLPDKSVEQTRETSKKKQKNCAEFEENLNYIEDVESVKCLGSDKLMVIPTKGISDQLKTQIQNNFSNVSLCMYHERIRNVCNSYFGLKDIELRVEFLFNLILMWEESKLTVIKFDIVQNKFYIPSRKERIQLIRQRLQYLKQKYKKNTSSEQPILSKFQDFIKTAKDLYELPCDKEESSRYNHYSLIHTLYSSWSFYVYPFTHRMKIGTDDCIHSLSKMKLLFPPNPNMYVLFHGKTVHNGAETKMASLSSTFISRDERLFGYITALNEKRGNATTKRTRTVGLTSENKTHREKMRMCFEDGECKTCLSYHRNNCFEVDLGQLYKELKDKRSGRNISQKPILGNLNECGFEVWVGETTRSLDYIDLKFDLKELSNDKKRWKQLDNNTDRNVAPVARSALGENQMKSPETIERFVSEVEKLIKKRTFPNREVEIGRSSILLNRASLNEQFPHRDYSPVMHTTKK